MAEDLNKNAELKEDELNDVAGGGKVRDWFKKAANDVVDGVNKAGDWVDKTF